MGSIKATEKRLELALSQGDFYTAEQSYLALYHRHKTLGQVDEARDALVRGAQRLLFEHEYVSASTLAVKYLNSLRDAAKAGREGESADAAERAPSFPEVRSSIFELVNAYPEAPEPETDKELLRVLRSALEVSSTLEGGPVHGDELLNALAAESCWRQQDHGGAQQHFIHSNSPQRYAQMLLEWAEKEGLPNERELFLTRAVLLYVKAGFNLGDAQVLTHAFAAKYGRGFAPLANFCDMLLKVLRRRNAYALFAKLREVYYPALQRDPALLRSLDDIQEMAYDVKADNRGNFLQSMMSDVMKGLMSGGGGGAGGAFSGGAFSGGAQSSTGI